MYSSQFPNLSQGWNFRTVTNNNNNGGGEEDSEDGSHPPHIRSSAPTPDDNDTGSQQLPPYPPRQDPADDNPDDGDYEDEDEDDELEDDEEEWDKNTAEIASISSEELHEKRPNRWTGNPDTWRKWTKNERDVWTSLEGQRMRDLGTHLYNAFALKRHAAQGKGKGKAKEEGEGEREEEMESEIWAPPKSWTAWPISEQEHNVLGDDALLPRTRDQYDGETIRRARDWKEELPSHNLEEQISALMLKAAKERFRQRLAEEGRERQELSRKGAEEDDGDVRMESAEDGTPDPRGFSRSRSRSRSKSRSRVPRGFSDGGYSSAEESGTSSGQIPDALSRNRKKSPTYTPTPLADDEVAYDMLRPAARRIINSLDETLTILHNARLAALRDDEPGMEELEVQRQVDAEENNIEAENEPSDFCGSSRKRRGRPRNPSVTPHYESERSTSRRGRPRKVHVPREGETEEEMRIRLAREQKRRLPDFYFESDGAGSEQSRSRSRGRSTAGRSKRTAGHDSKRRQRSTSGGSWASSANPSATSGGFNHQKYVRRLALRGWQDVIGAGTLAGFPPDALARATRRCEALFDANSTLNISMLLQPPAEIAVSAQIPTKKLLSGGSTAAAGGNNNTTPSRQPAIKLQSSPEVIASSDLEREVAIGLRPYLCPNFGCPRARIGFRRRWNLVRHMKSMHGEYWDEEDGKKEVGKLEDGSMDEMDNGLHVDGFLRPIKVRKGWRSEVGERPKKYRRMSERTGSRQRWSVGTGGDGDDDDDDGGGELQKWESSD